MNEVVISAKHISKSFRNYKNNQQRLRNMLFGRDSGDRFDVLKDVSFEINKGEKVGILGVSGSGKSTLIRLIDGLIKPDSGTIETNGVVSAIYDNRLGFDFSLNAVNNIQIKAAILGWSKEEAKEKEQAILDFAGIEDALNQPLRNMPKGTAARLGFAAASEIEPEILLYDESINFGGGAYDERYHQRLASLIAGDEVTFVMTVANPKACRKFCQRGIVLLNGEVGFDGEYAEAIKFYRANCKHDKKADAAVQQDSQVEEEGLDDNGDFGF